MVSKTITGTVHFFYLVGLLKQVVDLFKKGKYEEREESEAGWRQQARLLDGQNILSV